MSTAHLAKLRSNGYLWVTLAKFEIKRREMNNVFVSDLDPEDVDLELQRFSFDGIESESLHAPAPE